MLPHAASIETAGSNNNPAEDIAKTIALIEKNERPEISSSDTASTNEKSYFLVPRSYTLLRSKCNAKARSIAILIAGCSDTHHNDAAWRLQNRTSLLHRFSMSANPCKQ